MVFVNRLSVVASLLFVPPIGMWIAELPLDARRVNVASVLAMKGIISICQLFEYLADAGEKPTMPGSSASVSSTGSGYFSSMTSLPLIDGGKKDRCWTAGIRRAATDRAVGRRREAHAIRRESICRGVSYRQHAPIPLTEYGRWTLARPKPRCGPMAGASTSVGLQARSVEVR